MAYTVVDKGSKYFNTVLYTGNGSTRSITGVGFQPDWVWIKERSASASDHNLSDAVRGAGKALFSNTTGAEYDYGTGTGGNLRSFDSDGFSLGTASQTNANGTTFVSWNWDANGAGVSNTSGSITSTVSANTTSGFSIVSYTGDASGNSGTVGHGLGVSPSMIILKNRTNARNWGVWHKNLTATSNYSLALNLTDAQANDSSKFPTAPTSTVFTPGYNDGHNENGSNHIAYCFAEVKGFSKFGSYTGNGNADGTFVYTGFKPAFVLYKVTSTTDSWMIMDNKRDVFNQVINQLEPNVNNAAVDNTARAMDFLSNGFKFRSTNTQNNQSGATYIYMAFADSPFVSSKGIPCTAR